MYVVFMTYSIKLYIVVTLSLYDIWDRLDNEDFLCMSSSLILNWTEVLLEFLHIVKLFLHSYVMWIQTEYWNVNILQKFFYIYTTIYIEFFLNHRQCSSSEEWIWLWSLCEPKCWSTFYQISKITAWGIETEQAWDTFSDLSSFQKNIIDRQKIHW